MRGRPKNKNINNLTRRELEIIELLVVECLYAKEIMYKLKISKGTIDAHKVNIYRKLNIQWIAQLCKWYWTVYKKDSS